MTRINVTVDGVNYSDDVEPRMLLVHYLREVLWQDRHSGRLRYLKLRCLHRADGRSFGESCAVLSVQVDGADITTIEGLADGRSCIPFSARSTPSTRCSAATARRA